MQMSQDSDAVLPQAVLPQAVPRPVLVFLVLL